jgi:hypothetical protein
MKTVSAVGTAWTVGRWACVALLGGALLIGLGYFANGSAAVVNEPETPAPVVIAAPLDGPMRALDAPAMVTEQLSVSVAE